MLHLCQYLSQMIQIVEKRSENTRLATFGRILTRFEEDYFFYKKTQQCVNSFFLSFYSFFQ